jgi:hypothetical protein
MILIYNAEVAHIKNVLRQMSKSLSKKIPMQAIIQRNKWKTPIIWMQDTEYG